VNRASALVQADGNASGVDTRHRLVLMNAFGISFGFLWSMVPVVVVIGAPPLDD